MMTDWKKNSTIAFPRSVLPSEDNGERHDFHFCGSQESITPGPLIRSRKGQAEQAACGRTRASNNFIVESLIWAASAKDFLAVFSFMRCLIQIQRNSMDFLRGLLFPPTPRMPAKTLLFQQLGPDRFR